MHDLVPLSIPNISGNEWKYIKDCLDTGWVSSVGSYVDQFEQNVSQYVGTDEGVATVNGTAALHLSLLACGVQAGDEVLAPSFTFIAPINAIRYCNASPVFIGSDSQTFCMDVNLVREFLSRECVTRDGVLRNKQTGRKISAILPVHIFGHPVDMAPLNEIADHYHLPVIEDASESLGSEYREKKTGSLSTIGCFSFNGNKIITCGGGGIVTTNQKSLANRVRHLSTQANKKPFEYEHDEVGYNYRLTNIQAALGVAQLEQLDLFIKIKRKNASLYQELVAEIPQVELAWEAPWAKSNFWLCTLIVPPADRKPLMEYLIAQNIQVRPAWKLIHTLPMYQDCQSYAMQETVSAFERCISIPSSVQLTAEDIKFVVDCIKTYFNQS
ncbi:MAG: LegC family aminotransferase [Planctomycetes bacterium]|nr:LegC family aminotransferase [Planctomycetota bacterium]MCH9723492.1 LegC family aminotransferase [Planctomycetota bacterium]MCH9775285.1 LegC family aminotransferase [Planctomycetota bacterium]MCH9789508.1 LegC family aminotransferase [Planctomycetota bacterium]